MEVYIDFLEIGDYEDFYAQLKEKLTYQSILGIISMPFLMRLLAN